MRDDLHRMEMADRYLDGAMSAAERSEFEASIAASPELRQVIDEQRALREGMQRLHLRGALVAAHRGWVVKQWLPKIITLLVVGGLVTGGAWYWKQHPHLLEKEVPVTPLVIDTVQCAPADSARIEKRTIRREVVVDTVIYLIKDGKRVRVDSIPKGARVIGTEIKRKVETDTVGPLNARPTTSDDRQAAAQPERLMTFPDSTETPVANPSNAGLNYLTSEKPPTHLGQATEMQIARPKNSESQPEYPGGFDAMYLFLKKNMRVPEDLKMAGTVVVSFVVDEKGAIKEATVEQGFNKACDAEALRVVKTMPKWTPCQAEGKPVRSRIEVPLTFSPDKSKSKSSDAELQLEVRPMKIPRQLRNGGG